MFRIQFNFLAMLVLMRYVNTISLIGLFIFNLIIESPVAVYASSFDELDARLNEVEQEYQDVAVKVPFDEVALCEVEKKLAAVKMDNFNQGALALSEEDIFRLEGKKDQKCERAPFYVKTTAGEDQNQMIKLASEISNNNLDFILTLEQENGLWTAERVHKMNRNGTTDYGFCGLNSRYHWNFIQSEGFRDPKTQLEYCYNIFKQKPNRFYGYRIRNKHRWKFKLESA